MNSLRESTEPECIGAAVLAALRFSTDNPNINEVTSFILNASLDFQKAFLSLLQGRPYGPRRHTFASWVVKLTLLIIARGDWFYLGDQLKNALQIAHERQVVFLPSFLQC